MYVLEGVTPCIQSMQLQAGDIGNRLISLKKFYSSALGCVSLILWIFFHCIICLNMMGVFVLYCLEPVVYVLCIYTTLVLQLIYRNSSNKLLCFLTSTLNSSVFPQ